MILLNAFVMSDTSFHPALGSNPSRILPDCEDKQALFYVKEDPKAKSDRPLTAYKVTRIGQEDEA
jgi:hypothetical protein